MVLKKYYKFSPDIIMKITTFELMFFIIIFLLLIIISHIGVQTEAFNNGMQEAEDYDQRHFLKYDNEPMLVPWKGEYCENQGLMKAMPPTMCCIGGKCNYFRNCRCEDQLGRCVECYPEVTLDEIS